MYTGKSSTSCTCRCLLTENNSELPCKLRLSLSGLTFCSYISSNREAFTPQRSALWWITSLSLLLIPHACVTWGVKWSNLPHEPYQAGRVTHRTHWKNFSEPLHILFFLFFSFFTYFFIHCFVSKKHIYRSIPRWCWLLRGNVGFTSSWFNLTQMTRKKGAIQRQERISHHYRTSPICPFLVFAI